MSPRGADVHPALRDAKAIFFDFMGTCLDWHTGIVKAFPLRYPEKIRIVLSLAWREAFFEDIHHRFESGLPPEDIDITHARLLAQLLKEDTRFSDIVLDESEQDIAVRAWHNMVPWPDVPAALDNLRANYEVFVLANGTTRLQLDLTQSSKLHFNMLFSSQLLGETKPDPKLYLKALSLVGVTPEQAVMVAAHAYDLRAAKKVGLRTVYIHRTTEDLTESMTQIRSEVDVFVDGRQGTATCGLSEVARLMGT
jgi:2-haloalkanoic acid dehalogenase type II